MKRESGSALPDVAFEVAHPVNGLDGIDAVVEGFYRGRNRRAWLSTPDDGRYAGPPAAA